MAYGLDQTDLSNVAYNSTFPGAWGMFEEHSPYYISREQAGYPAHDIAKARQLADQYRQAHGQPLTFSLLIPPASSQLAVGQAIQAQAKEFGVDVQVETIEQTQLISRVVVSGDYQASIFLLWSSPTPDQGYAFVATKANPTGLSLNFTRFDDPDLTAAMDAFRASNDPNTRIDEMKKVQQSLAHNLQLLFLVHDRAAFASVNSVYGLQATPFPGTEVQADNPYPNTPFLTSAWRSAS